MVTGVGLAADEEGTQPIVKKAIIHSVIAAEKVLLCRIISILFFVVNWYGTVLIRRPFSARVKQFPGFLAVCAP